MFAFAMVALKWMFVQYTKCGVYGNDALGTVNTAEHSDLNVGFCVEMFARNF